MTAEPVYLWNLATYDAEVVAERVGRSMDEVGLVPRGRVLVKPNCVLAHAALFPHAFCRAEVLDGVLRAVLSRAETGAKVVVGERSGITAPTRLCFRLAGYLPVLRRRGVPAVYFDEVVHVEVPLTHPGRLRDAIYLPEPIVAADWIVNLPKLKTHPWTTLTAGLKNWIGLQDDAHRLVDHDHRLDEKIVDLNHAVRPQLVVIDGITAGVGRMLTPRPVPLGLLVVGANPVATDVVVAALMSLDPASVEHVRFAAESGLGPGSLDGVELRGDLSLDEARARATERGLKAGRERVEEFFAATNLRGLAGPPPEPERTDYCWGGCPGAAQEALDIIRNLEPDAGARIRPQLLLYGDLSGRDLELRPGEKALVFGDCARLDGKLGEHAVRCESTYVARSSRCIHTAKASGLVRKTLGVVWSLLRSRGRPYLHTRGCPVSVAEHVLLLSVQGRVRNPYLDRRIVVPFAIAWLTTGVVRVFRSIFGGLRRPAR